MGRMEQASLTFWLIVAGITLATIAAIIAPLLRRTDMDIYRSQLTEVDRDLARGVLSAEEAERTRTEIARRLLIADKTGPRGTAEASPMTNRVLAGLTAVAVLGGAAYLYADIGAPGARDLPRAERIQAADEARRTRMGQLEAEAQMEERLAMPAMVSEDQIGMIEQLREMVPTRPDELQGWQLLAGNEARMQNFGAAADAQSQVLRLRGDDATPAERFFLIAMLFLDGDGAVSPDLQAQINRVAPDDEARAELWQALSFEARGMGHFIAATRAQERYIATLGEAAQPRDFADLLDYMVSAVNGYVSPEAETIAVRLLQQDENNIAGLYYAGLLYAGTDRPDRAFNFYRRVIELGDPESLHVMLARRQIEDIAWLAGVEYTPPAPVPPRAGPSAEDIAAAQDMSEEDRTAMVESMVTNLSDRLARQGGTPDEWAQLIRALGVLGDTGQARAIWGEAQEVFATSDEALALIRAAATEAGIADGSPE